MQWTPGKDRLSIKQHRAGRPETLSPHACRWNPDCGPAECREFCPSQVCRGDGSSAASRSAVAGAGRHRAGPSSRLHLQLRDVHRVARRCAAGGGPRRCVCARRPRIADALEQTVKGREPAGHAIGCRGSWPRSRCGLPDLSTVGARTPQTAKIAGELRDLPVLTISDIEGFGELGGIAQFYFDQGRLRFSVNVKAAKRARLEISSKLLSIGETTMRSVLLRRPARDGAAGPPRASRWPRAPARASCSRCRARHRRNRRCPT